MRMSGELVEKFYEHGLMRSKEYLSELEADLKSGRYLLFKDAIEKSPKLWRYNRAGDVFELIRETYLRRGLDVHLPLKCG